MQNAKQLLGVVEKSQRARFGWPLRAFTIVGIAFNASEPEFKAIPIESEKLSP